MQRLAVLSFALAMSLLGGGSAAAQQKGQMGVTMGYPASAGLVWHMSDRVAIRPELTFSLSSNEVVTTPGALTGISVTTDTDTTGLGVGVSGIFYLWKIDNLSPYVSPRFSYARSWMSTRVSPPDVFGVSDSNGSSYSFAGSFGAQYSPHPRFNVFGEVGIGYTDTHISSRFSDSTNHQVGSRTGVGVIFYF